MEFNFFSISLGIVVVIIVVVIVVKIILNKKKIGNNKIEGENNNLQNGEYNNMQKGDSNTITNNWGTINNFNKNDNTQKQSKKPELTIEEIKSRVKVLFVDDKEFPIVNYLKSIGYTGVDYLSDIGDIDDPKVRFAHIIFLDINGVGIKLGFKNQGMGLCGAIKDKYDKSKRVILYSAETEGSIFDQDAKKADDTIQKDSDYVQFTSMITDYAKELL